MSIYLKNHKNGDDLTIEYCPEVEGTIKLIQGSSSDSFGLLECVVDEESLINVLKKLYFHE